MIERTTHSGGNISRNRPSVPINQGQLGFPWLLLAFAFPTSLLTFGSYLRYSPRPPSPPKLIIIKDLSNQLGVLTKTHYRTYPANVFRRCVSRRGLCVSTVSFTTPDPPFAASPSTMSGADPAGASPAAETGNKRRRTSGMYQRRRAVAACGPCRVRKTKCDNVRPACGFCQRNGGLCTYPDTSNDFSTYELCQDDLFVVEVVFLTLIFMPDSTRQAWPSWTESTTSCHY